ncbi:hypothetical protein BBJ28_00022605 [Nothophytophthora sp. Chile5]|nr:hypothetical protein BBJ28_00022605 [Nothophytophthora sp. Chile5]
MASPVRSRHSSLGGEIVPEGVLEEQSVTVSRQTRTMSSSSLQQHLQDEQSRQLQQEQSRHVEAMAQQSAAAQQLTFEQLQKFHDQQEEIVKRFSGYLQEQFQNQVQLKGDYDALRSQMEEQQQLMTAHNAILREASEKVGHQAHEIENLREVVHSPDSPRGHSRWGWFARAPPDETQDEKMSSEETDDTPHMTGLPFANSPLPLMHLDLVVL